MLTCAFLKKILHDTVHISINNFIFTHLSAKKCYIDYRRKLHWINKIREIWGCLLEALLKNLLLFIPQFYGFDETLIQWNRPFICDYLCIYTCRSVHFIPYIIWMISILITFYFRPIGTIIGAVVGGIVGLIALCVVSVVVCIVCCNKKKSSPGTIIHPAGVTAITSGRYTCTCSYGLSIYSSFQFYLK